jgi:prolyl oligopeptidase
MPPLTPLAALKSEKSVTDILHGVSVTDPYRWLEDPNGEATRKWIYRQTASTNAYFDALHSRERIRRRVRRMLAVETYDSVLVNGTSFFFRKRLPEQEQPCICRRRELHGPDEVLVDPNERAAGIHTSVSPVSISPDGRFLLYGLKEGGERTSKYEILEVETRQVLSDSFARGYLRGFAFFPDSRSFCYVHELAETTGGGRHVAYLHTIGTPFSEDREIFCAGEGKQLRLQLIAGPRHIGFIVHHLSENRLTDFYLAKKDRPDLLQQILKGATYSFAPVLLRDRILAITDRDAANLRIVRLLSRIEGEPEFLNVISESKARVQSWTVAGERIYVAYSSHLGTKVHIFSLDGRHIEQLESDDAESIRLKFGSVESSEVLLETESFFRPPQIVRYTPSTNQTQVWAERLTPLASDSFSCRQTSFNSRDGTTVPLTLLGRSSDLEKGGRPTIMTSYGGFGVAMTPRFSVLVTFMLECGCLFALPHIRGGSEFGTEWHRAGQRHNRQNAFDDFTGAAEWLIQSGQTLPGRLAIFGGSNSGLLVLAALTQRPELFRAVLCIAPLADMLRFHLFDQAYLWKEEFGTVEDDSDFRILHAYSPYHNIRSVTEYPSVLFVSGNADQNCNPLHARKMTAILQAENSSQNPILLDYSVHRGHSPVLPLTDRVEALTKRLAFLCHELGIEI